MEVCFVCWCMNERVFHEARLLVYFSDGVCEFMYIEEAEMENKRG